MSIPTQMSFYGFIASEPQLHFGSSGKARFHAKVGYQHFRKEIDGTFTELEPSYHDLVAFEQTAEKAYACLHKGDRFIASGYVHEYEVERLGRSVIREEFVARRIGHDLARTTYDVRRRDPAPPSGAPSTPGPPPAPAVGM